jgi:hypothetical protein
MSQTVSKKPKKGRLARVKERYKNIPEFIIDELSKNDPSGNNKYLEWSCSQLYNNYPAITNCRFKGDMYYSVVTDCIECVNDFHKMSNRLTGKNVFDAIEGIYRGFPNTFNYGQDDNGKWFVKNTKDINTYNLLDILNRIMMYIKKWLPSDAELRKEVDILHEDDTILILSPLTERASCKYGSGTRWCTAARNGCAFTSYTEDNEGLIYFIFKNRFRRPDNYFTSERVNGEKVALHWNITSNGRLNLSWYNIEDTRISVEMGKYFNDYYAQIINGGTTVGRENRYNRLVSNNDVGKNSTKVIKKILEKHIKENDESSKFKKFFKTYRVWL